MSVPEVREHLSPLNQALEVFPHVENGNQFFFRRGPSPVVRKREYIYSQNCLIESAITHNYLNMKYYLVSFMKNVDKKTLVNEKDSYGRPAIFYSSYFSKSFR